MDSPKAELQRRSDATSQRQVARELGVSPQYLHDVLKGRREPGKTILAAMGLEKQVTYKQVNGRAKGKARD